MKPFRVLVLGLALVLVLGAAFFWRAAIGRFFAGLGRAAAGGTDQNFSYANYAELKIENAGLKAEIQGLLAKKNATSSPAFGNGRYRFVAAETYSDYPWNDHSALTIAAGTDEGLKPGMPVMAGDGVLLGKVTKVTGTQSEVETIFDPAWKSSVAIGAGRVTALLVGGPSPSLNLVPRSASINAGDTVLSVDPALPLNLLVGEITDVRSSPASLWTEADIALPWNPSALTGVYVITNFP